MSNVVYDYSLYRVLDKMLHDRKGRYDGELRAIDVSRLSGAACTMIAAMNAESLIAGMDGIRVNPFRPPIILSDYPSFGAFPEFERWGIIL